MFTLITPPINVHLHAANWKICSKQQCWNVSTCVCMYVSRYSTSYECLRMWVLPGVRTMRPCHRVNIFRIRKHLLKAITLPQHNIVLKTRHGLHVPEFHAAWLGCIAAALPHRSLVFVRCLLPLLLYLLWWWWWCCWC